MCTLIGRPTARLQVGVGEGHQVDSLGSLSEQGWEGLQVNRFEQVLSHGNPQFEHTGGQTEAHEWKLYLPANYVCRW